MFCEEIGCPICVLYSTANNEGLGSAYGGAVSVPDGDGADDVDDAGFVFKGEEGDAVGCWGALAVSDDASGGDASVGFVGVDLMGGEDALCGEVGADELGGVGVGGDAGGPVVGVGGVVGGHGGQGWYVVGGEAGQGVGGIFAGSCGSPDALSGCDSQGA